MPTFKLDLSIREQSPVSGLIVLQWQCPFLKSSREKKVRVGLWTGTRSAVLSGMKFLAWKDSAAHRCIMHCPSFCKGIVHTSNWFLVLSALLEDWDSREDELQWAVQTNDQPFHHFTFLSFHLFYCIGMRSTSSVKLQWFFCCYSYRVCLNSWLFFQKRVRGFVH